MKITDREITKTELDEIYADFKKIEAQDGVPFSEQERHNIVAEENGIVVGFASGLTNHKWFFLSDMWVHEDYRRQGLGTKLLSMLEDKIQSIGMEHIYTWTSGFTNPIFYEKQGYYRFTVFEDFFEVKCYHHIGYRKDFISERTTESNVICRPATQSDIDRILAQFAVQNDNKPREIWDTYLREQENGERFVILAEADGEIAGYVTLLPRAKDAVPFLEKGIPEIKDFHVFKMFQKRGIGAVLMDRIETVAAGIADSVCLGVGLHSGYGAAQKMYAKRGYIFDGSGVWDGSVPAEPYGMVKNGDDLILYMSKKLK